MPVSVQLILIGAGLLIVGAARLYRPINSKFKLVKSGAEKFDWMALAMTVFGGAAAILGLLLAGLDLLKTLFTWLKS